MPPAEREARGGESGCANQDRLTASTVSMEKLEKLSPKGV
jgi:hypothetical protein